MIKDIIISDETLRDGEQQVGVSFTYSNKLLLARKIIRAGIHQIDIMPAVSELDKKISRTLTKSKYSDKLYAATMLNKKHIDLNLSLGIKNILLFSSISKRLLKIKKIKEDENLKLALSLCKYAKSKGIKIIYVGEDATRADFNYLIKTIKSLEKYIDGYIICDTVGVLTPQKTKSLLGKIINTVACPIGVHFHNDRGLANQNTLVAVENGASIISGTFGGIGERAGNADLFKIIMELKKKNIIIKGIDYAALKEIRDLVYKYGGSKPAKPYSTRAFWHESGIHVNALLKDPLSYNSFYPKKFNKKNIIFYGKHSGLSNYRYLFPDKHSTKELLIIRDKIKELAIKKNKSFTRNEVLSILIKGQLIKNELKK